MSNPKIEIMHQLTAHFETIIPKEAAWKNKSYLGTISVIDKTLDGGGIYLNENPRTFRFEPFHFPFRKFDPAVTYFVQTSCINGGERTPVRYIWTYNDPDNNPHPIFDHGTPSHHFAII